MGRFFEELRRRNVFRVAGLYGVVGWLLAQASSLMENALGLPSWFDAVVISFLLIGFPLVLVFAWVFEMTPAGLKKTADVPETASIAGSTGKKLDFALIGAVLLLAGSILASRFIAPAGPAAPAKPADAKTVAAKAPETEIQKDNSIAVLPFVDMSSAKDQEYFSDGISEELLNSLAQVDGLQVAGRTSSFAFKNQNKDLREIGEILKVSNILEGSVRKAGDEVRITAQLIKAADGYHLWSKTYDRELKDIFAVQDEIARSIVAEISPHLPGMKVAEVKTAARTEINAYDRFLLAREKMTQDGSKAAYEEAKGLLDEAIAADPGYAPALAWRAYAETMLSEADGGVGDNPMAEALPKIKEYADRAIAADPQSAEGFFALASFYGQLTFTEGDVWLGKTIDTLKKAVEIRPNFTQAQNDLAYFLDKAGKKAEAIAILEDILAHDPGLRDANVTYISNIVRLGRYDEADAAIAKWAALRADSAEVDEMRGLVLSARGEKAKAIEVFEAVRSAGTKDATLDRTEGAARYSIADAEWLQSAEGGWPAAAAILKGDGELAVARIEAYPRARRNSSIALGTYLPILFRAGQTAKVVDYYEAEFGSPDAVMKAADACDCSPGSLAASLKAAGHKDFDALMAAWKAHADKDRDFYAKSVGFTVREAERKVLSGDLAAARGEYARAMDLGGRDPLLATGAMNQIAPKTEDFAPLRARMKALINSEREKLGLAPL